MAELNLWIDSYDDIYSDFDSRHYLKRRISEDFLHELHIEMKYMEGHAGDLVLLLPKEKRDEQAEKMIAASLTDFFASQFHSHREKCRNKLNKGAVFFMSGVIIMLLNSWLSFHRPASFPVIGLKVLLEPAGWFLLWAALDFWFYDFAELKKERSFFKELSEMHIRFTSS